MANVALRDIRDAARRKYASFTIDLGDREVEMKNVLRCSDEAIAEIQKLQDRISSDDASESLAAVTRLFELTMSDDDYLALVEAVGDDRPVLVELASEYGEATQAGEASPSES